MAIETNKHNTILLFLVQNIVRKSSLKLESEIQVGKSSEKSHIDITVTLLICDDFIFYLQNTLTH